MKQMTSILLMAGLCLCGCQERVQAMAVSLSGSPIEQAQVQVLSVPGGSSIAPEQSSPQSETLETLIEIPGGSFQRDANPQNISTVNPFLMARYEVTRQQFVDITGLADPSLTGYSHGMTDPVQSIYWYHTLVFCNRLSDNEGLAPVYSIGGSTNPDDWGAVPTSDNVTWDAVKADWNADGYRLPTEMEWMWAAMGADSAAPGQINRTGYRKRFAGDNGSNGIDDYAWWGEGREGTSRPVGGKLPNELGLYDMTGNAWEWVWDRLGDYPDGALNNYNGPETGDERVLRGGSWLNPLERQSMVFRYHHTGGYKWHNMGFRVVRNGTEENAEA